MNDLSATKSKGATTAKGALTRNGVHAAGQHFCSIFAHKCENLLKITTTYHYSHLSKQSSKERLKPCSEVQRMLLILKIENKLEEIQMILRPGASDSMTQ